MKNLQIGIIRQLKRETAMVSYNISDATLTRPVNNTLPFSKKYSYLVRCNELFNVEKEWNCRR